VEPASLLQPDETAADHSITILLPDGQRILYECFTVANCARGFRLPSFIRKPDSFALDMLARIGANLARNQDTPSSEHRTVAPGNHDYSPQFRLTLEKTAPSVEFALPAPGLYDITITDALNTPRINLFLAAIHPSQSADFQSFPQARATMEKWNADSAGWPIDDFLRAYLASLVEIANH
jgi:hypothetical protein